jgi:hypothetical protein
MREDAEVELNVWPCEMYQHVISPFRHDKDEGLDASAAPLCKCSLFGRPILRPWPPVEPTVSLD